MQHLFESRGLLRADLVHPPSDMFRHLFCGIPSDFGHAQFLVDMPMHELRVVMAVGDCFLALVDAEGFSDSLHWAPTPMARDPENLNFNVTAFCKLE